MKKSAIVAAAVIMLSQSAYAAEFTDTNGHWAQRDISRLSDKGIINGMGDGSFYPEGDVTRAQYLKMMMEAVKIPAADYRAGECLDTTAADWYGPYLQSALDKGLIPQDMIVGYKAVIDIERNEAGESVGASVKYSGAFNGNVAITREEAAYMTMALCQYTLNANTMTKLDEVNKELMFADENDISSWALPSVWLAASNGIINGMEDGSFQPSGTTTRAQAAVMINRLLLKLGE
ncbi:MAG: S-layer homology domain-containing protein [bacterium]|nr:S-layer homology domain-containing protein [bacterium]